MGRKVCAITSPIEILLLCLYFLLLLPLFPVRCHRVAQDRHTHVEALAAWTRKSAVRLVISHAFPGDTFDSHLARCSDEFSVDGREPTSGQYPTPDVWFN